MLVQIKHTTKVLHHITSFSIPYIYDVHGENVLAHHMEATKLILMLKMRQRIIYLHAA
jgi:hypothetical protein